MWKKRELVFLTPDNPTALSCPKCDEVYLHQGNTAIYERKEDAPYTTVISQNGHEVTAIKFPSEETHNPSSRRHGLTIEFTCEHCHGGEWDARRSYQASENLSIWRSTNTRASLTWSGSSNGSNP
jgi:hypothetical protein